MADLSCDLGRLRLKNPVMTASGTFGYGREYHRYYDISCLGAVVVKGICLDAVHGNPTPRVAEVSSGILNAIGLQGPGVDKFLHDDDYMPFLRSTGATVIVNIWGRTPDEYGEVAARIDAESEGVAALEVNISCPNVKHGGAAFGSDPKQAAEVVSLVRRSTRLPLITKLSPNVSRIADLARAAVDAGSDMVSLVNTLTGMAIDVETRRPRLANLTGGLSGPAIKPVAIRMVYETARAVSAPIIGMGGIMNGNDAVEFMLAGASAVAVGTANFVDPMAAPRIIAEIEEYLDRHGCRSASELVGAMELG